MINTIFRLIQPRHFEIEFTTITLSDKEVLVKPTFLSICQADQRYYQGLRDAAVLAQKLPMALIHEGIGEVVFDPTGTFDVGDRVVMIPNLPRQSDCITAENYLCSSKFCSSSCDGFMREYVSLAPDRLILLPTFIENETAAFTELISVAYHAVERFSRFSHERRDIIGVWGDGNVSYLVSLILKRVFPYSQIYVFGVVPRKLSDFTFADRTYLTSQIDENIKVDHAFECVGGDGSQSAINQMIDVIRPEGTLSLLGVSEYPVAINTRTVLEKGLRIFGSSRSGRIDFEKTVSLYQNDETFCEYLHGLVYEVVDASRIADIEKAFELDANKSFGKTVMRWQPDSTF